ncbi:MAG: hypothetical protein NC391_03880 [Alistipes timonensis]|nr:hypothetical protein [Alistipes timonensis]
MAFQILFGWIVPVWPEFNHGYSVISFLILYMIGRLLRAEFDRGKLKAHVSLLALLSAISVCGIAVWTLCYVIPHEGICGWIRRWDISYVSPVNIAFAAAFLIVFARYSFKSSIVNRLASSAFAVYLIHENPLVRPFYQGVANLIFSVGNPVAILLGIITLAFSTYLVCFAVDCLRRVLWNKILHTGFIGWIDDALMRKNPL